MAVVATPATSRWSFKASNKLRVLSSLHLRVNASAAMHSAGASESGLMPGGTEAETEAVRGTETVRQRQRQLSVSHHKQTYVDCLRLPHAVYCCAVADQAKLNSMTTVVLAPDVAEV